MNTRTKLCLIMLTGSLIINFAFAGSKTRAVYQSIKQPIKKVFLKPQATRTPANKTERSFRFKGHNNGDVVIKVLLNADITQQKNCDALVNAAKTSLLGGGGIDGAIHKAAGPELKLYCQNKFKASNGIRCPVGQVRITPTFGKLRNNARYLIHAVGPMGSSANRATLLKNVYQNIITCACANNLKSIVIPTISTGIYGYPIKEATDIAVDTILAQITLPHNKSLKEIRLTVWTLEHYTMYLQKLEARNHSKPVKKQVVLSQRKTRPRILGVEKQTFYAAAMACTRVLCLGLIALGLGSAIVDHFNTD